MFISRNQFWHFGSNVGDVFQVIFLLFDCKDKYTAWTPHSSFASQIVLGGQII